MSAVALPPEHEHVIFVPMLPVTRAIDLFLGDFQRRSRSKSGRVGVDYRRTLDKFADTLPADADVTAISSDDCRRFLDLHLRLAVGTQSTYYAHLNSFLEWLYQQQRIRKNPLDHVRRPRRVASEDLDVTTVATTDIPRLLEACETDSELLALAILVYLGPRRGAVAALRLRDYDQLRGQIRFHEKGSKTIWKPVPAELAAILDNAIARGVLVDADDYLVPAEGPLSRSGERDDRVIWRIVKRVADNAGIEAHVHSLRAAFAVFYLESYDDDILGLQEIMGHRNIETTRLYLRKLDKQRRMERVRGLSWASVSRPANSGQSLGSSAVVGAGGFEPPEGVSWLNHAPWKATDAKSYGGDLGFDLFASLRKALKNDATERVCDP